MDGQQQQLAIQEPFNPVLSLLLSASHKLHFSWPQGKRPDKPHGYELGFRGPYSVIHKINNNTCGRNNLEDQCLLFVGRGFFDQGSSHCNRSEFRPWYLPLPEKPLENLNPKDATEGTCQVAVFHWPNHNSASTQIGGAKSVVWTLRYQN